MTVVANRAGRQEPVRRQPSEEAIVVFFSDDEIERIAELSSEPKTVRHDMQATIAMAGQPLPVPIPHDFDFEAKTVSVPVVTAEAL